MPSATWKGDESSAESCTQYGLTFKKGESVDLKDLPEDKVAKLAGNKSFEVSGYTKKEGGTSSWNPPSQQPAQYPVPKPGEPVSGPEAMPKKPGRV